MGLGIILYAHGARDPRWSEPFDRLRDMVASRMRDVPVRLAFLEYREPDLTHAALDLIRQGVGTIRVVPMFFGRGGHLREDFPRQLDAARARLPQVSFELTCAAGEDETVLEALARFAAEGSARSLDQD